MLHPSDGLENARVLAEHLRGGGYDVVLFGKLAVDDYGQQTGAMVAELLELPCATAISKLEIADGRASVEREVEGGVEQATCALPAVFTCDKGLNNPRLPSLKGIMAAKKKPLEVDPGRSGDRAPSRSSRSRSRRNAPREGSWAKVPPPYRR